MRRNIIKSIAGALLVISILLVSYQCAEEFQSPYKDNENVELTVKGIIVTECGGIKDTAFAQGANILILQKNKKSGEMDTLGNEVLNDAGLLELFEIADSKMGASNLTLQLNYRSYAPQYQVLEYMCCDDTVVFVYDGGSCNDPVISEISCDTLDLVLPDVKITNTTGGCLKVGTDIAAMSNNKREIPNLGENTISVDLTPVLASSANRFYANASPKPDGNGRTTLSSGQTLYLDFFVKTTAEGAFDTTFVLANTCIDSLGNSHSGTIRVKVSAEICPEDVCNCPFNADPAKPDLIDKTSIGIEMGTSRDFNNETIFTLTSDVLGEGCYLKVVELKRYLSTDPVASISASNEARHDWTLTSSSDLNQQYKAGNTFQLSARFAPDQSGTSADTFEIRTVVYNENNVANDTCSRYVVFEGFGCGTICPQITKFNYLDAVKNGTNLKFGASFVFNQTEPVTQSMSGVLGSLCFNVTNNEEPVLYKVEIPKTAGVELCQPAELSLKLQSNGQAGDLNYFTVVWTSSLGSKVYLDEEESTYLGIIFNPPGISDHIQSNHDSIYSARLIIETGISGCSQEIVLNAVVKQNNVKISDPFAMFAFSQISTGQSDPAYMVYDIDLDNGKYYGGVINLKLEYNQVNVDEVPHVPSTTVNENFFFEVNDPTNVALSGAQVPENLSLVNSPGNNYSCITSQPVAYFNNVNEFKSKMNELVNTVFKVGNFMPVGIASASPFTFSVSGGVSWTPRTTALEMSVDKSKRLKVQPGEVYLLWNPGSNPLSIVGGGSTYSNYCEVAFIYINGLSNGSGDQDKIGKVSFYMAYPLNIVKN